MGQTETAFIKAYNDSNTQPFDVALNRLWKRLDKKPCCGSLGKKDTIKFLNSVCELCEKEKRNWPSDVGPSLREGIVEKWYKSLDPPNSKIVSWEDVLRAIGSSEACTEFSVLGVLFFDVHSFSELSFHFMPLLFTGM